MRRADPTRRRSAPGHQFGTVVVPKVHQRFNCRRGSIVRVSIALRTFALFLLKPDEWLNRRRVTYFTERQRRKYRRFPVSVVKSRNECRYGTGISDFAERLRHEASDRIGRAQSSNQRLNRSRPVLH
jgi:hypothetical protein